MTVAQVKAVLNFLEIWHNDIVDVVNCCIFTCSVIFGMIYVPVTGKVKGRMTSACLSFVNDLCRQEHSSQASTQDSSDLPFIV